MSEAEEKVPDAGPPRFSWAMRIFLTVLVFNIVFRSLTVLVPWRDWTEELKLDDLPWRLPTRSEIAALSQQEPTEENPAPLCNRVLQSFDDVWEYLKPWPGPASRPHIRTWGDAGKFTICWLSSRFEFAENLVGTNQEWPMFSPNVARRRTLARSRLLFEDGSQQTVRLSADPPDLTRYSHWFTEKVLDYELLVDHDRDARFGYCNLLSHRYPRNEAGSPLRAIFIYTVNYRYPSPQDDAVEFLRAQNGPPPDQVGPVMYVYDVRSRFGEDVSRWPAPDSDVSRRLGDLAGVAIEPEKRD